MNSDAVAKKEDSGWSNREDAFSIEYDSHKSFAFNAPTYSVSKENIEEFDLNCRRLKEKLKSREISAETVKADLRGSLGKIFDDMRKQATDEFEELFLNHLELASLELLFEEIDCLAHYEDRQLAARLAERYNSLDDNKFFCGNLEDATVKRILEISKEQVDIFRDKAQNGQLTREDLSVNGGPVVSQIVDLLNKDFGAQGILEIVSKYMGQEYRVGGLALELSHQKSTWWHDLFSNANPPRTLYAHFDQSVVFPKAIVYLSNVKPENGPTVYYPDAYQRLGLNSLQDVIGRVVFTVWKTCPRLTAFYKKEIGKELMASENFRRHFMRLPSALRFNSHFGWDVIPGSQLEESLCDIKTEMLGPAGTFIVFDGASLLHGGGMVSSGERLALQVIFMPSITFFKSVGLKAKRVAGLVRGKISMSTMMDLGRKVVKAAVPTAAVNFLRGLKRRGRIIRTLSPYLPKAVCVDVGASYFPHMKWDLFLHSSKTDWVAVEPNAQNLSYIQQWKFASKVSAVKMGLSEVGGRQKLYVTNIDSGSSLLEPTVPPSMKHRMTDRQLRYFFPFKEIDIQTLTLQNVIDQVASDGPVFVKLDTQGTELSILRGAQGALDQRRILGIEMECGMLSEPVMKGSGKFWEACQFLETMGFELIDVDLVRSPTNIGISKPRGKRYLTECDAIFVLRYDIAKSLPVAYRANLLAFYLSYDLFEEAVLMLRSDSEVRSFFAAQGADVNELERKLLSFA